MAAYVQKGAVSNWLTAGKRSESFIRGGVERGFDTVCEIYLIGVSGPNVFLDLLDLSAIRLFGNRQGDWVYGMI